MNDSHIETLEQVRQFLDGAAVMEIAIASKSECLDSRDAGSVPASDAWQGEPRTDTPLSITDQRLLLIYWLLKDMILQ